MSDDDENSFKIPYFNRKVVDVPCFRDSFLYGILSGFGAGIGHFLYTSRVKRSCDLAVFSFTAVTAGYWVYCRYRWSKDRFVYRQLKAGLREYMVDEGTTMINPKKPEDV